MMAICFWEATFSYQSYDLSGCFRLYISCKNNIGKALNYQSHLCDWYQFIRLLTVIVATMPSGMWFCFNDIPFVPISTANNKITWYPYNMYIVHYITCLILGWLMYVLMVLGVGLGALLFSVAIVIYFKKYVCLHNHHVIFTSACIISYYSFHDLPMNDHFEVNTIFIIKAMKSLHN